MYSLSKLQWRIDKNNKIQRRIDVYISQSNANHPNSEHKKML